MTHDERGSAAADPIAEFLVRPLPVGAEDRIAGLSETFGPKSAVYLSTPITSGKKYMALIADLGPAARNTREFENALTEIIRGNVHDVAPLKELLQKEFGKDRVIVPTEVEEPDWTQADYHRYWAEVIRRFVRLAVFSAGWQWSTGCTVEYCVASEAEVECFDADLARLGSARAMTELVRARNELEGVGLDASVAQSAVERLHAAQIASEHQLKDSRLSELAKRFNVASFVSFAPGGDPYVRFHATSAGDRIRVGDAPEDAIPHLISSVPSQAVNVRTFRSAGSKSGPFVYELSSEADVMKAVREFAAQGLYTIVNETIDVNDGGVSGVTLGDVVEFVPDDTPRGVEGAGVASGSLKFCEELLTTAYGFDVELPASASSRFEFSIHPTRVGQRSARVVVWEEEPGQLGLDSARVSWPNRFSRHIGDKTFGLLVAHLLGANVPMTRVISRRIAPFDFGQSTGTTDWWLRTAPSDQTPGHFTTLKGWSDPFNLLADEDPDGRVAAVLCQEGVESIYSGASRPANGDRELVEGVVGLGDNFMLGSHAPAEIPEEVVAKVVEQIGRLRRALGRVRIEWAWDGESVWILQLHLAADAVPDGVFYPGDANTWLEFDPLDGLEALKGLIAEAGRSGSGILVTRPVGLTSHVGDIIRKSQVPGRLRASK